MRFWVSFHASHSQPSLEPVPAGHFWETGVRLDGRVNVCVTVEAQSEEALWRHLKGSRFFPDLEPRFCDQKPSGWLPSSDRFHGAHVFTLPQKYLPSKFKRLRGNKWHLKFLQHNKSDQVMRHLSCTRTKQVQKRATQLIRQNILNFLDSPMKTLSFTAMAAIGGAYLSHPLVTQDMSNRQRMTLLSKWGYSPELVSKYCRFHPGMSIARVYLDVALARERADWLDPHPALRLVKPAQRPFQVSQVQNQKVQRKRKRTRHPNARKRRAK